MMTTDNSLKNHEEAMMHRLIPLFDKSTSTLYTHKAYIMNHPSALNPVIVIVGLKGEVKYSTNWNLIELRESNTQKTM